MSRYARWARREQSESRRIAVMVLRLEEGELAERFGEAYLAYKEATPFIVPRRPGPR